MNAREDIDGISQGRLAGGAPHLHAPGLLSQASALDVTPERVAERRHLMRTGAIIGWATIAVVIISTLLPHMHQGNMHHAVIWALGGVAALVNGFAALLSRRELSRRVTFAAIAGWVLSVFAFVVAITNVGGGFNADYYLAFFPALVFAATLLPPPMGAASGLLAAALYVGVVLAAPGPHFWGNVLVRSVMLIATAAIAAEIAALERTHARQLATSAAQADARAAMVQEVHHRVKNDLQTVVELLSLEVERSPGTDVARVAENLISRIQSMAAVHRLLASAPGHTDGTALATRIAALLSERFARRDVAIQVEGDPIPIGVEKATCLALAVNELLTNAYRHAFRDARGGSLRVALHQNGQEVAVRVEDDGAGFDAAREVPGERLGLILVQRLVSEGLDGRFSISSSPRGTLAAITFGLDGVNHAAV